MRWNPPSLLLLYFAWPIILKHSETLIKRDNLRCINHVDFSLKRWCWFVYNMFSQRGITQFAGYLHFWRAPLSWAQRNPVINNIVANEPHRPPLWSFHPKFINILFYSSGCGAEMLKTTGQLQPTLEDETRVRAALFDEIKRQRCSF